MAAIEDKQLQIPHSNKKVQASEVRACETDRVTDEVKSRLGEKTVRSQPVSTVCQRDKMLFSPPQDQTR